MKKTTLFAFAALAAAGMAAPAAAQLTPTRVDACFLGSSGSSVYQTGNGPCAANSGTTYWNMPGSYDYDDDLFTFQRATPPALTFGGSGLSNVFNLGYFQFDNNSDNGGDRSSVLRLQFSFDDYVGEWNYDGLTVNYDDRGNNPEWFSFGGGAWSDWFTVDGEEYRFAVVGFDTPHPGNSENYCKDYDGIPSSGQYSEASGGKLCGQFEKKVQQVAEPATLTLVAAGFAGLVGVARRRRNEA